MARKQVKEKKITKPKLEDTEQLTTGRTRNRNTRKDANNTGDVNQNIVVNDDERALTDSSKQKRANRTKPDSVANDASAGSMRQIRKRKSEEKEDDRSRQPDKKFKIDKRNSADTAETIAKVSDKREVQAKAKSTIRKKGKDENIRKSHRNNDKYDKNESNVNDANEEKDVMNCLIELEDINLKANQKLEKEINKDADDVVKHNKSVLQDKPLPVVKIENSGCESSDIMSMLMQMEGPAAKKQTITETLTYDDDVMSESDNDGSDDDNTEGAGMKTMRKGKDALGKKPRISKSSQKQNVTKEETVSSEETVSKHFMKPEHNKNTMNVPGLTDDEDEDFVGVNDKITRSYAASPVSKLVAAKKRQSRKRKSDDAMNYLAADLQDSKSNDKKNTAVNSKKKKVDNEQNNGTEPAKIKTESESPSSTNKHEPNSKGKRQKSKSVKTVNKPPKVKKNTENEEIRSGTHKSIKKETETQSRKVKSDAKENKSAKSKKSKSADTNEKEEGVKTENKGVKEIKEQIPNHIKDSSDVMSILMHMEGPSTSQGQGKVTESVDEEMMSDSDSEDKMNTADDSDESEGEWEDVEDHHVNSPKKTQAPSKSVEITLDAPVIYKKRKKKEFDLHDYLKKQVNKYKRELALDMHKVHLLCLISREFYLNSVCGKDVLRAQVMSVVMTTRELTNPVMKRHSQGHLTSVLKWIKQEFHLSDSTSSEKKSMEDRLTDCLQSRSYADNTQYTMLCVLVLRYLGFMVRLVMSLQPVPYKQAQKSSSPKPVKKSSKTKTAKVRPRDSTTMKKDATGSGSKSKTFKQKSKGLKKGNTDSEVTEKESESQGSKRNKRRCSKNLSKGAYKEQDEADIDDVDGDVDDDLDDDFKAGDESDSDDSELEASVKDSKETKKGKGKGKKTVKRTVKQEDSTLSLDSDFEEDSILGRTMPLKKEPSTSRNKKVLSSDSESSPNVDKKHVAKGNDIWLEVYIKAENKWISVCSHSKEVAKPAVITSYATSPLYYVIGIDNNSAIKDVTIRYASEWLTKTRKLRVEDDWWMETLEPFVSEDKERDVAEDKDMQAYLLQGPLPTSISQFKGHPLYILKRHLLKYEALYPNTIVPLGYIRGEPVYSRDCCHTLHSRENWLKEGRCVRLKEEPYKFVKSRKRWNDKDTEPKECELFGKWQTEIYMPPPAVDGVIPRNAHGNVEMFQPWMLPGGTVHLKGLPALNRIARKLNLDCAPAMVGWDHHCGYAHPVMDGWIVCEEHKDILLAAWDEEQEIIQEREKEKREKRVYGNWKKLIRGLVIKESLKQRYDQEDMPITAPSDPTSTQESTTNEGEKATDVEQSWPLNRLTKSKSDLGIVEKL